MYESFAHCFELREIVGANLGAISQSDTDLRDELAELVDSVRDSVEGAILEVFDSLGHIDDKWIEVFDAGLEAGNLLSLQSTD